MKRLILFIAAIPALALLYLCLHILIVFYPRPLFSSHLTEGHFTIHARGEIKDEIIPLLDRVDHLLSRSTLNDPTLHHTVYLCNSTRFISWLMMRNVHFGVNLRNGTTILADSDIVQDVARCKLLGPNDSRIRTLSGAIAHEITHHLIRRHTGIFGEKSIPSWIQEGYCDNIAGESAISDEVGIRILKGHSPPIFGYPNFKHRLMVQHLIEEKGMTIEEILSDPPDYRKTEAAMLSELTRTSHTQSATTDWALDTFL